MTNLTIRQVCPADFPFIYEFTCGLEDHVFDRDDMRRLFDACIVTPNRIYLIAEYDGQPAGYISCHGQILMHHCGWVYEIQELYVLPEHRSKKIGAALVRAVEDALQGTNCVLLEVASNLRREKAHAFYEKLDYKKTSYKFIKDVSKSTK